MRKRAKLRRFRWRVCQRLFAVALLLIATGFFFSDHLLRWGVRSALTHIFPEAVFSFHEVRFEKRGLRLTQFRMAGQKGEVATSRLFFRWDFTADPFVFLPHIEMREAEITLKKGLNNSNIRSPKVVESLFFSSERCQPSVTIDHGTLQWRDNRLEFSFQSRRGKEGEIHSCEHNFFCGWKQAKKGLEFDLNLEKVPLALFSPLTQAYGMEITGGEMTFSGIGALSLPCAHLTLKGEGVVQHLSGRDTKRSLSFGLRSGSFVIDVPSEVKEFSFRAQLEEGSIALTAPFHQGRWDLIHLSGEVKRERGEPFKAETKGACLREVGGFAFRALAQGDSLLRWDADVMFEDQEEANVHLCSDQSGVNIFFNECDALLLDLGQEVLSLKSPELLEWEVTEGVASGELKLKTGGEVEFRKLICRDLRVHNFKRRYFCALKKGKAQGVIGPSAEIAGLHALINGLDADLIQDDGDIWNLSNVSGTFSMREGQIVESKIQGTFLGLEGALKMEGPALFSQTHFKLKGGVDQIVSLFSQELSEAYHEHEELPVKMAGRVMAAGPAHLKVVVDLFVGKKQKTPLHLEATLNDGSIETASFTSRHLPHTLYAPLITSIFPSLELGGEWVLSGAYEKGSLTCNMVSTNALIGHAAYPLILAVDHGGVQATLKGDVTDERWHLSFPHFKGELKGSKPFAFAFETSLDITKERGSAWSTLAKVENGSLQVGNQVNLSDLSFEAHFDEKSQTLSCHNVKGVAETTRFFDLSADAMHFSSQAERWAWGTFALKQGDQPPIALKIEALSGGRNPQSFLLLFQKEQESPLFFQGKTQADVWIFEPLPEGRTD